MKVQLQHKRRREGGVSVGTTRYTLDERGVVEVSEEHAGKMLQGSAWRPLGPDGQLPWDEPPPAPPMIQGAAGRRPRTREELLDVADIAGVPPPGDEPKVFDRSGRTIKPPEPKGEDEDETTPDLPPAPAEASEPEGAEEETIEVSMDMTKAQLLEVCEQVGIEVPKGATKAKLLELITQGD